MAHDHLIKVSKWSWLTNKKLTQMSTTVHPMVKPAEIFSILIFPARFYEFPNNSGHLNPGKDEKLMMQQSKEIFTFPGHPEKGASR